MLTRRRNRDTLFVFHTRYFIYLGLGSWLFIFVSIGVFVEISLVNETWLLFSLMAFSSLRCLLIPGIAALL